MAYASPTPGLSNFFYSEVFEIVLAKRGAVKITLSNESWDIEFEDRDGTRVTFVDVDTADDFCGHDMEGAWDRGYEEGTSEWAGAAEVLLDWHRDNHIGPIVLCLLEPCRELQRSGLNLSF